MEWLQQNWFWLAIFIAFIGMHLFGHGGHGGGCGGSHGGHRPTDEEKKSEQSPPGHQH